MRHDEAEDAAVPRLPAGYSPEAKERGRLVLIRADGSTVATSFVFSAFGPTPDALREAAEEHRLRRLPGNAGARERAGK